MSSPRFVVPLLGLGQAINFASSYYLLGVMADPAARAMGMGTQPLFLALSIAFLISAALTPLAGLCVERFGGARVLIVSHLAFALALGVLALAQNRPVLCLGVALLGVGMGGGLYGTAFAVVVEIEGQGARRAIAAVSLLGALGGALGWPISRAILDASGWRGAFAVWAIIQGVVCLPVALFLLPRKATRLIATSVDAPVRWCPAMIRLAAFFAGAWAVSTAMGAHLPRLLGDLGLDAATAAWVAGLMAASAIGARLIDLTVLHRSHPILTARAAALLHPVGAVIASVAGPMGAPAVAIGQGLGNGFLSVASGVLPLVLFGPDRYARRQAMLLTPARYLQAAAPAAYALAMDVSPYVALTASSLVCLVLFALTFGLRQTDQRPLN
ncbi:MFS transporter [Brevundimonas sp. SORGH_AS_0993]|uniref:MFS transporter n=1 Tax=Brevundimonas sp. SORGH_AS_0993 TaxID=3041794 RepID=UPI00278428A9|nr:MFS transporter [Brevundimonas sp. SORGH_AS_0993]MDQ1155459.1 MFS family permease [Brevundimonas sp. SORGH_AS_0993]